MNYEWMGMKPNKYLNDYSTNNPLKGTEKYNITIFMEHSKRNLAYDTSEMTTNLTTKIHQTSQPMKYSNILTYIHPYNIALLRVQSV